MKSIKLRYILLVISLMIHSIIPLHGKTINEIVENMPIEKKITQTFMMDFTSWNNQAVTTLNDELAEVISNYDFGGIILFSTNITSIEQTYQLTNDLQKAATKDDGIPLIISTDQEGGSITRLSYATTLPGNMAIGATSNPKYAYLAGEIIGEELQYVGVNTALSPVVDINNNANNPVIGLRSFGDDPSIVGTLGISYQEGLHQMNTISCLKHFPGHGNTTVDSHYGLPKVSRTKEELLQTELKPYIDGIQEGIDMIMTAHILYPKLDDTTIYSNKTQKQESRPATLSKKILTDLLKDELGFQGVICSDALNMSGITDYFDESQAVIEALNAGVDFICMPCSGIYNKENLNRLDTIIQNTVKAIKEGKLSEERLDDAVTRILELKMKRGILDHQTNPNSLDDALKIVGGKENKNLEAMIAAKAVTVIENKNNVLPLKIKENQNVLFLYPYQQQKDRMLEGWKKAKEEGLIPETAKINTYQYYRTNYAIMGTLKNALDAADIVIVNSEVSSDNSMLYTTWTSAGPNTIVNYCKETNKTAIVMSIDKPYDVQLYKNADGIIAVYGNTVNLTAGIEVILGVSGASGKLPLDIPVFNNEKGIYTEDIFYQRGYGLTYPSLLHPDTPIHFEANSTEDGIELKWDEVDEKVSYQVYRDGKVIYHGSDPSFIDTDIQDCNYYSYQVSAKDEIGESDLSDPIDIYYIKTPSFTVRNWFFHQLKLQWDSNEQIDGYIIIYTSSTHQDTITIMDHSKNKMILDQLFKNEEYTITIQGFKSVDDQIYYSNINKTTVKTNQFILF